MVHEIIQTSIISSTLILLGLILGFVLLKIQGE
ncbi:cytochrome b6-f complex subunit VII (plastid) [Chondrus crispus]|uniref:Cytochrome b6-f complex subunit 7 n=1 Tax=Chondrus crispus TaxID=2769 RepID=M5DCY7_CHOCR|nr:cytochrome b6-f complex subunit VII [Chondrus crispus]CCP38150.1 cytochrome b6-f complex subunit VII [Chondrus crispus]|eukprot:YP_007627403.1 cytochrome b6-f complex subunit VII (plastid) [Chondrus crispus]